MLLACFCDCTGQTKFMSDLVGTRRPVFSHRGSHVRTLLSLFTLHVISSILSFVYLLRRSSVRENSSPSKISSLVIAYRPAVIGTRSTSNAADSTVRFRSENITWSKMTTIYCSPFCLQYSLHTYFQSDLFLRNCRAGLRMKE